MFKRRKPLTVLQTIKELCWPSMGWGRALTYVKHRVLRLSDTPRNIALGLAFGAGVSFSPIMATHFVQAGLLSLIFRANIPASLIGTIVGNPWTFPFIWGASIALGSKIFKLLGLPTDSNIPSGMSLSRLWEMLLNDPMRVAIPWLVGGYILCIIAVLISYPIYLNLIKGARKARQKARLRNVHNTAKQMTGQKK